MYDLLAEAAGELVATAVYAVGALALTALGLVAEVNGLRTLGDGDLLMAVWFAALGLLAIYVGAYLVGYRTVLSADGA
ncbi:MAG: hypothetical protein ABEJ30_05305 [Halorientalis sp.]